MRKISDETKAKISKAHIERAAKGLASRAKDWLITCPDGVVEFKIRNLRKYCKDNRLDYKTLMEGKEQFGYTARLLKKGESKE